MHFQLFPCVFETTWKHCAVNIFMSNINQTRPPDRHKINELYDPTRPDPWMDPCPAFVRTKSCFSFLSRLATAGKPSGQFCTFPGTRIWHGRISQSSSDVGQAHGFDAWPSSSFVDVDPPAVLVGSEDDRSSVDDRRPRPPCHTRR